MQTYSYAWSFSLLGVFIPTFLLDPGHSPVTYSKLGLVGLWDRGGDWGPQGLGGFLRLHRVRSLCSQGLSSVYVCVPIASVYKDTSGRDFLLYSIGRTERKTIELITFSLRDSVWFLPPPKAPSPIQLVARISHLETHWAAHRTKLYSHRGAVFQSFLLSPSPVSSSACFPVALYSSWLKHDKLSHTSSDLTTFLPLWGAPASTLPAWETLRCATVPIRGCPWEVSWKRRI